MPLDYETFAQAVVAKLAAEGEWHRAVSIDLETKIGLLQQILSHCLSTSGFILVADIAFPDVDIRTAASQHWQWDEDEYYWAADETVIACKQVGLQVAYEQISSCGGVFNFTSKGAG